MSVADSRRLPPSERAGTRLRWESGNIIELERDGKLFGCIDQRQQVAQLGGEAGNFIYHKLDLVTLPLWTWEEIALSGMVATIEMIDHRLNVAYVIDFPTAQRHGEVYSDGIGERFGVPRHLWVRESGPVPPLPQVRPPQPTEAPTPQLALDLWGGGQG